jgi:uncharacterized protein (DUF1778 family)
MAADVRKDEMIKIRIDDATLSLLERARAYVDLNKSKFIRMSIREKAEEIIADHERTYFGEDDWYMFFDMLDNPPPSTDRMIKAAQKYHEIVSNNEV